MFTFIGISRCSFPRKFTNHLTKIDLSWFPENQDNFNFKQQKSIKSPLKYLQWNFLCKYLIGGVVNCFRRKQHLRRLIGFWMCIWAVSSDWTFTSGPGTEILEKHAPNTLRKKSPHMLLWYSIKSTLLSTYRSSRPEVFCKIRVLENFTKFLRKHLCQSLF